MKHADANTKLIAYNTLIRSGLEHACQIWDLASKTEMKKLNKMRNKCLKFMFNIKSTVSFSKLREDTGIPSLPDRRKESRLRFFCKVQQNDLVPSRFEVRCHSHSTRQGPGLYLPSIKNCTHFTSFFPRTICQLRETASWCLLRKQCNFPDFFFFC